MEWLAENLLGIQPERRGGGAIAEIYRVMGVLGEQITRLDTDSGGMNSPHDDHDIRYLYQTYHQIRGQIEAVLKDENYVNDILCTIERHANWLGVGTSNGKLALWYLGGTYRGGAREVEHAVYLTARQIGTQHDSKVMYHSFIPPTFVRAGILVQTPAWVQEYTKVVAPSESETVSEPYETDPETLDYVRGLWRGEGGDLCRTLQAAEGLRRASKRNKNNHTMTTPPQGDQEGVCVSAV